MTTINLKDFYYWYTHDEYIEVPDEVAEELKADKRYEAAYRRRVETCVIDGKSYAEVGRAEGVHSD